MYLSCAEHPNPVKVKFDCMTDSAHFQCAICAPMVWFVHCFVAALALMSLNLIVSERHAIGMASEAMQQAVFLFKSEKCNLLSRHI